MEKQRYKCRLISSPQTYLSAAEHFQNVSGIFWKCSSVFVVLLPGREGQAGLRVGLQECWEIPIISPSVSGLLAKMWWQIEFPVSPSQANIFHYKPNPEFSASTSHTGFICSIIQQPTPDNLLSQTLSLAHAARVINPLWWGRSRVSWCFRTPGSVGWKNRACGARAKRWAHVRSRGHHALPRRSSHRFLLFGSRAREFLSSRGDSFTCNGLLCCARSIE